MLLVIPFDDAYGATAPTYIASAVNVDADAQTSCTVTVNVTASTNFIIVGVNIDQTVSTVTDENGQTYTQRLAHTAQTNKSYFYTTSNPVTNSANTITVTSASGDLRCFAITMGGVYTTTPIGNTGSTGGASGSGDSIITFSTANSNSHIVTLCGNENTATYTFDTNKIQRQVISNGGANKFSGSIASEAFTGIGSNDSNCNRSTSASWSHIVMEVRGVPVPTYSLNNMDIYQDGTTTLGAGTAICTDVTLTGTGTCGTSLERGVQYRIEFQVDNTGDGAGSPNTASAVGVVTNISDFTLQDATDVGLYDGEPRGIAWNNDGTKMYFTTTGSDKVYQFTCNPFDTSTCVFFSFKFIAEDALVRGIDFSNDGTKMYVSGSTNDKIYEYACTAWEVSTCVFTDDKLVSAQDSEPFDIEFSSDGTKFFFVGNTNDDVYEYNCTAFDVSTCSFVDAFSTPETTAFGLVFSNDGKKMFVTGETNDLIYEYSCTAWDISTCTLVNSKSITTDDTNPRSLTISSDDSKLFMSGTGNDDIYEYKVSSLFGSITVTDVTSSGCSTNTNWVDSISTSSVKIDSGTTCSISASGNAEYWFLVTLDTDSSSDVITFSVSDGLASDTSTSTTINVKTASYSLNNLDVYQSASQTLGSGTAICENVSLTSPSTCSTGLVEGSTYRFEIQVDNTGSFAGSPNISRTIGSIKSNSINDFNYVDSLDVNTQDTSNQGITWNNDGTKFYLAGNTNDRVYEYDCTAWDISTCVINDSLDVSLEDTNVSEPVFSSNGEKFFFIGNTDDDVYEYNCTAFDVSTCSFVDSFDVGATDTTSRGLAFSSSGTKMFVSGGVNDRVYEYDCTAWDISTCVLNDSILTDPILEPFGLTFSSDGTKMYLGTDNTSGANNMGFAEYICTAFDVSTCVFSKFIHTNSQDTNPRGIALSSDGTKMFVSANTNTDVYEYTIGTVFGSITVSDVASSGCSTNTNWIDSIFSTNLDLDSGTTCSISAGGNAEYWFIVTIDNDASNDKVVFSISDLNAINDFSSLTTFTISGATGYTSNLSDGVKSGDSKNRTLLANRTFNDGAKAGDTNIRSLAMSRLLSDGAKAGDTSTRTYGSMRVLSDGAKVGDTKTRNYNANRFFNDGAKAGNDIDVDLVASLTINLSDGAKAGDILTKSQSHNKLVIDGAKAGDSLGTVLGVSVTKNLIDGAIVGDYLTTVHNYFKSFVDGAKAGDYISTSIGIGYSQNLSDGAKTGDTISTSLGIGYSQNISDGAKAGDTLSTILGVQATQNLTDGAIVGDSLSTLQGFELTQNLSDGIKAGDYITTLQGFEMTQNLSDGAKVSDSISSVLMVANTKNLSDGVIAGENVTTGIGLGYFQNVFDGAKAGDYITTLHGFEMTQNLSDGAKAGDSISSVLMIANTQNVSDGAKAGDTISTSLGIGYSQNLSDGAKTGDTISTSVGIGYSQNLFDGAIIGDNITTTSMIAYTQSLSDGAIIGDTNQSVLGDHLNKNLFDGAKAGDYITTDLVLYLTKNLFDGAVIGDYNNVPLECDVFCSLMIFDGLVVGETISSEEINLVPTYNAIKITINAPTYERKGGVFAFVCPAGEFAYGIDTDGNLLCDLP